MRKVLFLIMVVMLASPAWATIKIIAVPDRDPANIAGTINGSGVVAIKYEGAPTERARAFALDIIIDEGVIENINHYVRGISTATNKGYGIFPGSFSRYITVTDEGEVDNWDVSNYTPLADPNDPGALTGLNTSGITIEMGSLYVGDSNAPNPQSGLLCTIKCSQTCVLSVTINATRGGVVLEDASEAVVDLAGATDIDVKVGSGSGTNENYTGSHPEQWIAVGQPDCWVSSINPRQCHGDADGTAQGKQQFWVSTNDLDILIAAWNKPLSALSGSQICADFDHLPQGKQQFRVSTNDLDILIANWNKAGSPAADCP